MLSPDALRDLVDRYLAALRWSDDTGALGAAMRYATEGGGKRIRPVVCLAVVEAAGAPPTEALAAATALELVHTFSLVHDDLPAMDNDDERRGRPTVHRAFDEGVALLAGDALLVEAFRLALTYDDPEVARELAEATAGMIGGQYLDIAVATADSALASRLKTGRLFAAAVGMGLTVAGLDAAEQVPWRRFADDLGQLFQLADDLIDGDGHVSRVGEADTRALAARTRDNAIMCLGTIEGDTAVLVEIVGIVAHRAGL